MLKKLLLTLTLPVAFLLTACADPVVVHNNLVAEMTAFDTAMLDYDEVFLGISDGDSTDELNSLFDDVQAAAVDFDEFMEDTRDDFSDSQQVYIEIYDEDLKPALDNYLEKTEEFLDEIGDTYTDDDLDLWIETNDELTPLMDAYNDLVDEINARSNY